MKQRDMRVYWVTIMDQANGIKLLIKFLIKIMILQKKIFLMKSKDKNHYSKDSRKI